MSKTILKVDVDVKMSKRWLDLWITSRKAILESIGIKVNDVVHKPSSKRGYHFWFHVEENGRRFDFTPSECNRLGWLLGDDFGRVLINEMRIQKGIPWSRSNILFSRVLSRSKIDDRCLKCGNHKLKMALLKEFNEGMA